MKQAANLGLVVVGDGFNEDAPGDNPSEGIGLMEAKLSQILDQIEPLHTQFKSLEDKQRVEKSRALSCEREGKLEKAEKHKERQSAYLSQKALIVPELTHLREQAKALKAQIDLQKKYS
jgi:hypothetical protein